MLLTFLACLLILFMHVPHVGSGMPWYATVAGVALLAGVNGVACWVGSRVATGLSTRGDRMASMGAVRVFQVLNMGVIGLVLVDVYALGWLRFVDGLFAGRDWMLGADEVVRLAPALLMLATALAFRYGFERRRGHMNLTLPQYLLLRFRVEIGIILAPLLALVLVSDATYFLWSGSPHYGLIDAGLTFGFVLALVVFGPAMLRALWRTSSLPQGALRDRLEGLSRANRFRCRDILIWHTHGHLPNAGVIGFVPWTRYVMLTDAVLEHLSEDEIEAVFAHEVGHVRRHHFTFYLLFAFAFVCFYANALDILAALGLMQPAQDLLDSELNTPHTLVMVAFAALYWWLAFGWMSRRHEQQADIFALRAAERPESFITALQRLAWLSGTPERAGSWRHFSIRRRTAFLARAMDEPELGERLDRSVRRMQLVLLGLFAAGALRLLAPLAL